MNRWIETVSSLVSRQLVRPTKTLLKRSSTHWLDTTAVMMITVAVTVTVTVIGMVTALEGSRTWLGWVQCGNCCPVQKFGTLQISTWDSDVFSILVHTRSSRNINVWYQTKLHWPQPPASYSQRKVSTCTLIWCYQW